MSGPLVTLAVEDSVATITLNNPPVNAVSPRLLRDLHSCLDEVERQPAIRCCIFEGEGEKAFCAGADLRDEERLSGPEDGARFRAEGRRTVERIELFRVPIVAAIQGWCIGGGTAIGWACDVRIAADTARFRAGDAYLGVIPSWGMGLQRLPRIAGRNRALDILVLGEDMSAAEAHALGLISKVVPRAELGAAARAAAARIVTASPTAMRAIREAVAYNLRHSWDDMAVFEEELCQRVFGHPDAAEGMSAMMAKQVPKFQDVG